MLVLLKGNLSAKIWKLRLCFANYVVSYNLPTKLKLM